jgi:bifunctional DNase/RNase
MLEMNIESIRVSLATYQRVVILRVKETNKFLPIWIGPAEADSIAMKLQDVDVPRPMTHDLLNSIISSLGATVSKIVVSDLNEDTFYAKIVLQFNGTTMEVDSRPSDAIALAVRTEAPIFAESGVVDKAAIQMDEETGKPVVPGDGDGEQRPVREEELRSLSAFTDFIETLNLDDLGREEKPPSEPSAPDTETV